MNKKYNGCSVDNCPNKHLSKSFCRKHYEQIRAWGHIVSDEERSARYKARPRGALAHSAFKKGHISLRKGVKTGKPAWNRIGEGVTSESRLERLRFKKQIQPLVFACDNYTCQFCDQYGGKLQVDHIKGWADYPELRFEMDNCRTLCMACHYYVTFKRKLPQGVIWGHNLSRRIVS